MSNFARYQHAAVSGAARIGILSVLHQAMPDVAKSPLPTSSWFPPVDYPASRIFVSVGTEGFSRVMDFASYKKDSAKLDTRPRWTI